MKFLSLATFVISKVGWKSTLGIVLAAVFATEARAEERSVNVFYRHLRSTVGVFHTGHDQMIVMIGPDSAGALLPPIDPHKKTFLCLFVVPNAIDLLAKLSSVADVTGVITSGTKLSDSDIVLLVSKNPGIKTLFLRSHLSVGKDELGDLSQEEMSSLKPAELSEKAFQSLSTLRLQTLEISGYRFSISNIELLENQDELLALGLGNTEFDDRHFELLLKIRNLRRLYIDDAPLTGSGLSTLSGLLALKTIRLRNTNLNSNFSDYLSSYLKQEQQPNLDVLNISGNSLSSSDIEAIKSTASFTHVKTEHFSSNDVLPLQSDTPQAIREHRTVYNLAGLICGMAVYGERNPEGKLLVTSAEFIRGDVSIGNWLMSWIGLLDGLKSLKIGKSNVSDEGVKALVSLKTLEHLLLDGARGVTDAAIDDIHKLKSLKTLSASGTGITEKGVVKLCQCKTLVALVLNDVSVGNAGAEAIAALPQIKYLSLRNASITDEGALKLLSNPSIKLMDLTGNDIVSAEIGKQVRSRNESGSREPLPPEYRRPK